MNNKLITMQKMLLKQMERLDDNELMQENAQLEISRANALSQNAVTFLKSVNVGLRIIEVSKKYETTANKLSYELGVTDEE